MRIAALYDVHGNLPALEAALAEIEQLGVDCIVVGGDVVPGPIPNETLRCLSQLVVPVSYLRGNGESAVLAESAGKDSGVPAAFRAGVQWNAAQLTSSDLQWIASWPATLELPLTSDARILFCHATPRSETEIFTVSTPEERIRPAFADLDCSLVVCGHTHMQFDRMIGDVRVVNAGSVGMPFGEPGAYWLLLGGDEIIFRHTRYDLGAAAGRIRASNYPETEQFAERNVLHPPRARAMIELFDRMN